MIHTRLRTLCLRAPWLRSPWLRAPLLCAPWLRAPLLRAPYLRATCLHLFQRLLMLAILGSLLFTVAPVAVAQDVRPSHTDPAWQATYWTNRNLAGSPALQRFDMRLDFDWGLDAPDQSIGADDFSARWERYIDVTPGTYEFTATADDGIRVWVDDQLIIDQWYEHAVQSFRAERYLGPGHHLVRVEYFEARGAAVAKLTWQRQGDPGSGTGEWRGEYFNNSSLAGPPALVRNDGEINFNWAGAPAPQINADNFSVRWSRNLTLPAGTYRFRVTTDDGARLFVNGHTLIDAWLDQAQTTYTGEIYLTGGTTSILLEYYERSGGATAQLAWQRLGGDGNNGGTPITDWKGEYFNNRQLSGPPALIRNDREINFDWGTGSPAPGQIQPDDFSVRWSRTLNLGQGTYRFTAIVDDGVRLLINGRVVLESWREQGATPYSVDIYLPGGPVQVEMRYYEATGGAVARLYWEKVSGNPPPSGNAVIVDSDDPGFTKGGSSSGWREQAEGYGGDLLWSRNNDRSRDNYNWGRWYPDLRAGRYEVFVYIPERYTTTGNARYWISHRGGLTVREVSQSANGDRWVSLGTYEFHGTDKDYVSLADVTFEYRLSRLIAWDAMKWEPR